MLGRDWCYCACSLNETRDQKRGKKWAKAGWEGSPSKHARPAAVVEGLAGTSLSLHSSTGLSLSSVAGEPGERHPGISSEGSPASRTEKPSACIAWLPSPVAAHRTLAPAPAASPAPSAHGTPSAPAQQHNTPLQHHKPRSRPLPDTNTHKQRTEVAYQVAPVSSLDPDGRHVLRREHTLQRCIAAAARRRTGSAMRGVLTHKNAAAVGEGVGLPCFFPTTLDVAGSDVDASGDVDASAGGLGKLPPDCPQEVVPPAHRSQSWLPPRRLATSGRGAGGGNRCGLGVGGENVGVAGMNNALLEGMYALVGHGW